MPLLSCSVMLCVVHGSATWVEWDARLYLRHCLMPPLPSCVPSLTHGPEQEEAEAMEEKEQQLKSMFGDGITDILEGKTDLLEMEELEEEEEKEAAPSGLRVKGRQVATKEISTAMRTALESEWRCMND